MQEIRKASWPLLEQWWERAVNTPNIARFLNGSAYIPNPDAQNLTWLQQYFLSYDQQTMLNLALDRDSELEIGVGLWSLHSSRFARALACGKALKFAMQRCNKLNARTVRFTVLATNKDCLRLVEKQYPGTRWGICPEDCWDAGVQTYVASYRHIVFVRDYK